jgi:hypothetical protein
LAAGRSQSEQGGGHWDWQLFAKAVAIVSVFLIILVVLITRRRVAVWKGQ